MRRDDERPEDDEVLEPDEGDDEKVDTLPPAREPKPHELPDIYLTEGRAAQLDDKRIGAEFSPDTADFIHSGRAGFAVRLHGAGVQRDFIDAFVFSRVIEPLARATRWIGSSVTRRPGFDPGLAAAFAGASLIVHFTMGEDENPVPVDKKERLAPTVAAGRYMAGLIALAGQEARLLEGIAPLGRLAVIRYAATLERLAEHDLSVDWLTRDMLHVHATPAEALSEYRVLHSEPEMRQHEVSLTGLLETAAAESRRFRLVTRQGPISGTYLPSAEATLDGAWNHQVTATIRVREPLNPSLPRAAKPVYTLVAVTHISPRRSG